MATELERLRKNVEGRTPEGKPLLIALRGVAGSGKSTVADYLVRNLAPESWKRYSADDLFTDPETGEYRYDAARQKEAHNLCLRTLVTDLVECRFPVVLVDNTNTTQAELQPYAALAEAFGYDFLIVEIYADPGVAACRNRHGVPREAVFRQYQRLWTEALPTWWPRRILLDFEHRAALHTG